MPRKSKDAAAKAEAIAKAWEDLAPDAKFAGLTVTQYRNATKPSADGRSQKASLRSQLRGSIEQVVTSDADTRKTNIQVVSAIKGDPNFGPDSPLYAAAGYVPDSLRKSGLTKKNGNGNGNGNSQPKP
jgi:hypothetical protein